MVVHSVTYMPEREYHDVVIPQEVREAMSELQADNSTDAIDAFKKLSHATFNNAPVKELAGNEGAVKAIVHAMLRFKDSAEVQENAFHALRNICFHCEPNIELVRQEGGISAVVEGMEKHLDQESLLTEGLWALVVFCSNHDANVEALKPRADILEKIMSKFPNNTEIDQRGKFLRALVA